MYGDEPLWHALLDRLADLAAASLRSQIEAGAQAVQLFDSWVGTLSPPDYRRYVLPHSAKVLGAVAALGVPRIHFGTDTGELLGLMAEAGADVVGVDWRTPLDEARRRIPAGTSVQGNLDPVVCLCPWEVVRSKAADVLAANGGRPGHIFNLGHGVLPETDPTVLDAARRGRARRRDRVTERTAVLLMAYGTPSHPDEIEAYYTDIRRGRPPPPELLANLVARYDAIGGLSPLRPAHGGPAIGVATGPRSRGAGPLRGGARLQARHAPHRGRRRCARRPGCPRRHRARARPPLLGGVASASTTNAPPRRLPPSG